MFGRSFKAAKCKTSLRLAISRIKLLKNKRDSQIKQTRRDLAHLFQSGQEASARIQVEHVIREQNIIAAYEFIELFCELIVARLPIIESQKNCPIDLREAISSLIFAAPRCADIPELSEIRSHFGLKYGKEFVASATELRPECGVNRTVIEKLSARTPSGEVKLKIMKEIAKEHQIEWDPTKAEKDLSQPSEDLLDGPSKFIGATKIPVEPKKESYKSVSGKKHEPESQGFTSKMPHNSESSHSVEVTHHVEPSISKIAKGSATAGASSIQDSQCEERNNIHSSISGGYGMQEPPPQAPLSEKDTKPTDLHQENLGKKPFNSLSSSKRSTLDPGNMPADEYDSSWQSGSYSSDWNMNFKDVASAAQAAAYSAEKASEAAKAAAELSKHARLQKKDSRKAEATSFSQSSSEEETMDFNKSWVTRKPSSDDYTQFGNESIYGNDLSRKHHVETSSEKVRSYQTASGQSSQQKGTGEIDSDYELPTKSTSRLDSYQRSSDKIADDNMPSTKRSAHVRNEEARHVASKEEKPYGKKDFIESAGGPESWRREPVTSYSSTQPFEDIYDSLNKKSEIDEEPQKESPNDNRDTVSQLPLFDGSPRSVRSNTKWSPQKNEQTSVLKESFSADIHSQLYQSGPAFQPPMWPPSDVSESSQAQLQYSFSNRSKPSVKASRPSQNASYDSSSSEDDISNSRMRRESSPDNLMQSAKWSFNDRDNSLRHSTEMHAKNGKSQRNAHHKDEIAHDENEDDMNMIRNTRTDLYHQSPYRVYPDGKRNFAGKSQPLRREQDQFDNSNSRMRRESSPDNLIQSAKWSFNDHDNSLGHSTETHAKNGKSQRNAHHEDEIAHVKNEDDMPMRRNTRTDLYHQPPYRVYLDSNRNSAEKSQPLRREQGQLDKSSRPNRQETSVHVSAEESPPMRGDRVDPHSNTQAPDIYGDSDDMTSESEEEIELESYKDNGRKVNRISPLRNSTHNAALNSKYQNPKHTDNMSAPISSSTNESYNQLSKSSPQLQTPKKSLSSLTESSQIRIQPSSSAGESKAPTDDASKRTSHVHPKLPDYDDLAARFAAMKRQ